MTRKRVEPKVIPPHTDGDWVIVCIDPNTYVAGIIARSWQYELFLAYFFPQQFHSVPNIQALTRFRAQDAMAILWITGVTLCSENWTILAGGSRFRYEEWPVPMFWEIGYPSPKICTLHEFYPDGQEDAFPARITQHKTKEVLDQVVNLPYFDVRTEATAGFAIRYALSSRGKSSERVLGYLP